MNKKVVGLLCGVVVVAGLSGALIALNRTSGTETSSSSTAESSDSAIATVLSNQKAADVVSIAVTNASGSFEVVRTKTAADASDGNAVFNISGFEDLSCADTSMIGTLANNLATVNATNTVAEHCEDLSKYGLEPAVASAVMTFADGSTFSFRIGNAVSGGEDTYFVVEGSDTVYTVQTASLANYQKAETDFLSKTLVTKPADDNDTPIAETISIERQDLDYQIVLQYDKSSEEKDSLGGTASTHTMVEPVAAYLSSERSKDVISGLYGLTATSIKQVHPTDSDLEEAGLGESDCFGKMTMQCDNGTTYVLRMGPRYTQDDPDAGTTAYHDIYLEGLDVIYSIQEEKLPWSTVQPTDIASKLIFTTYVWDIGELKVEANGAETMDFVGSGTDKDNYQVTLNGTACDRERFRLFYSFILNASAEQVVLNETAQGDPLATITLKLQNGGAERVVSFYQKDDFTCLISINGESAYTCRLSFVQTMIQNMKRFSTDEEFVTSWS